MKFRAYMHSSLDGEETSVDFEVDVEEFDDDVEAEINARCEEIAEQNYADEWKWEQL